MITADYLRPVLTAEGLREAAETVLKHLRPIQHTFQYIAFRGMSGALVAPLVAAELNKDLVLVRKEADMEGGSHSSFLVEAEWVSKGNFIILDDLIVTGETINAIYKAVRRESKCRCVGIVLWEDNRGNKAFFRTTTGKKIPLLNYKKIMF